MAVGGAGGAWLTGAGPRPRLRLHPVDHLAFGYSTHGCAGQGLARIEGQALISSLLRRVERIELAGDRVRHLNPTVRGLKHLPVSVVPARG